MFNVTVHVGEVRSWTFRRPPSVTSSAPAVVAVEVEGNTVTATALAAGEATVSGTLGHHHVSVVVDVVP